MCSHLVSHYTFKPFNPTSRPFTSKPVPHFHLFSSCLLSHLLSRPTRSSMRRVISFHSLPFNFFMQRVGIILDPIRPHIVFTPPRPQPVCSISQGYARVKNTHEDHINILSWYCLHKYKYRVKSGEYRKTYFSLRQPPTIPSPLYPLVFSVFWGFCSLQSSIIISLGLQPLPLSFSTALSSSCLSVVFVACCLSFQSVKHGVHRPFISTDVYCLP